MSRVGKKIGGSGPAEGSIAQPGGGEAQQVSRAERIDATKAIVRKNMLGGQTDNKQIEEQLEDDEIDVSSIFGKVVDSGNSQIRSSSEFQLKLASFVMRQSDQVRATGGVAARRGLDVVEETLKMMEHLHIMQTEESDK